jgi:hypothetical protein
MSMSNFVESTKKEFLYYKHLGEKTIEQLTGEQLFWQYNSTSNSIAIIVKHLRGNMVSRWTDFLTSDGEKEWRDREAEFDNDLTDKNDVLQKWNEGWSCLINAIEPLQEDDLTKIIYIRNQGHTVLEAIHRQVAHYAYHVGQIVFIGKMILGENWKSLSIPRGKSKIFNEENFAKPKRHEHFTDELLSKNKGSA